MGWVVLLLLGLTPSPSTSSPQLWEWGRVEGVEGVQKGQGVGDRTSKSLAFLPTLPKEEEEEANSIETKPTKVTKKAKLNVSDKDSPYALIDKYFPERESYFYQNRDKFEEEYRGQETKTDLGNISPAEVWLADDNLLVLKGGSTADRQGWDNPWQPLDDFQAPYREPVLPPPDFDPDSLEIGVGVDIDTLLAEREEARRLAVVREDFPRPVPDIPAFIDPVNALKPFQDEVIQTHQKEFRTFFNDVSQFISDMENFHSARKATARQQVEEPTFIRPTSTPVAPPPPAPPPPRVVVPAPPPPTKVATSKPRPPTSPTPRLLPFTSFPRNLDPPPPPQPPASRENSPAPNVLREVHHSASIEVLPKSFRETPPTTTTTEWPAKLEEITPPWHHHPETTTTSKPTPTSTPTAYPLSYSSPHSKVFLSTKYVTHGPSPTPTPSHPPTTSRPYQARTVVRQTPRPSPDQSRGFTFHPEVASPSPVPVRIFRPRPTTKAGPRRTSPPPTRRHSGGQRAHHRDAGVQEEWRPVTPTPPPHRPHPGKFNPAPTPFSLFQSVPENIGETDVFHLSQNVDFGKKIEARHRGLLTNEVDTGFRRHGGTPPFSPAKQVVTRSPRLVSHKARQPPPRSGGGFRPSLRAPPAKKKAPASGPRGRSSLRRRRPKAVSSKLVDRAGHGDVRYVSFYSGTPGGNNWGYSYNLG